MGTETWQARWPAHLPAGALRVVRWSARYEETVTFYRDTIGLPVLETFHDSYGLDGTILGLPNGQVHLEIVRAGQASYPGGGLDQLVFYLPDAAAREQMEARLAAAGARPVPQIDYWQANGGVTYQDPDGREVVWCSHPGSISRQDRDQPAGTSGVMPLRTPAHTADEAGAPGFASVWSCRARDLAHCGAVTGSGAGRACRPAADRHVTRSRG